MPSEAPLDPQDLWEMPPLEIDPELIETSQRLVSLSEAMYNNSDTSHPPSATLKENSHLAALETRNKYLFSRNIVLTAKAAELEAANSRLQEQLSALKQAGRSSKSPWYLRWLKL